MQRSTTIDRMRFAIKQYRIDQPDSYTFAIYGPDEFYELHDSFSTAFERKEELGLLAAMKAISAPSKAMIDAGAIALKSGQAEQVWRAFVSAIIAEYQASRARDEDALVADPET